MTVGVESRYWEGDCIFREEILGVRLYTQRGDIGSVTVGVERRYWEGDCIFREEILGVKLCLERRYWE